MNDVLLTTHTMTFKIGGDWTHEALDANTDDLADALIDLEQAHSMLLDSTVTADLGEGIVEVSVTVRAETLEEATGEASEWIHMAIHAAGATMSDQFQNVRAASELLADASI